MYTVDRIDPNTTALIVVDMENDFVATGAVMETPSAQALLPQLNAALAACRKHGIPVIYTTHAHRSGGCDLGLLRYDPRIGSGTALVDDTPGIDIYPDIAPHQGEIVIKKHRFSAFYNTDLEIILRGLGVDTVVITGVTTENCCHATARDAYFRDYQVIFLSDATGTVPYPDLGYGPMTAEEVHQSVLVILARDTADVIPTRIFIDRIDGEAREIAQDVNVLVTV